MQKQGYIVSGGDVKQGRGGRRRASGDLRMRGRWELVLVIVAGILNLAGCDEHDHKYEVVVPGKGSKDRQDVHCMW